MVILGHFAAISIRIKGIILRGYIINNWNIVMFYRSEGFLN